MLIAPGTRRLRLHNVHVEAFLGMFYKCTELAFLDVSGLDTSNATDLRYMFADCTSLDNLKGWPFSIPEGTDLALMFEDCPFSRWSIVRMPIPRSMPILTLMWGAMIRVLAEVGRNSRLATEGTVNG